jgi:hypothetical protein
MPWEKYKDSQLLYRFPNYRGWHPSPNSITSREDALWDIQNMRLGADGVVASRGGWSQYTTGDTDIRSVYSFNDGGGAVQTISIDQSTASNGILRKYDDGLSDWSDTEGILRYRAAALADFTVIPNFGGDDFVVVTDGVNPNLKWNLNKSPLELTGTEIFSVASDEEWAYSDAGVQSSTQVRINEKSIKLTDDSAAGDTATISYGGGVINGGTTTTSNRFNFIAGDVSDTERECAFLVTPPEEFDFDGIRIRIAVQGTPTGNLEIRCETDDSGEPSGTLIDANATTTDTGPSADGYHTATFGGTVTQSAPFWIVVDATSAQSTNQGWRPCFWGSGGAYTLKTSDDSGTTWDDYDTNCLVNFELTLSTGTIDLETNYDDKDEIILWVYLDGTTNDIDLTNSSITFVDDVNTMEFVFTNQIITASQWNKLVIPRESSTTGDWTETNTMDWTTVSSVIIKITDGGSDCIAYFDQCYIRKTRKDSSTGTNDRPFISKFCEVSPVGDRLLLANTEKLSEDATIDSTIFGVGPQFIWYSNAYDLDTFGDGNYIAMPEAITAIHTHGGLVHVWSRHRRWVMEPNYAASDFNYDATIQSIYWDIRLANGPGTMAFRSVSEGVYNNQPGIFYLADDGIYFTNGIDAINVSNSISILWSEKYSASAKWYANSFDKGNWGVASGVWFRDRYYLSFYGEGDSDNEMTIILNTRTGEWEKDINAGAVYPRTHTISEDSNGIPFILTGSDNGETYRFIPSRATNADDGNAYVSYFQTPYIGLGIDQNGTWDTLNLWVHSDEADALDIRVECFDINEDTTNFDNWDESLGTAQIVAQKSHTPTAFQWTRLRIPLIDKDDSDKYLFSRGVSFKIYDQNNEPVDFMPESIIYTSGVDELMG